ncbi:hypothetical protein OCK02_02125 [Rhizobium sp. TRM96647]|uniref:hypothetical protein n=1 Tax=unclassified Rhizobium TaxID=2613769 RepID=UPI0021E7BC52|nr:MULTISPECIES: hypothetical protein [unclassified Rhizobium]MCV3734986.1 hypothetical protein [Rhizobium sp. TRM96647]MCV3757356.1 hypothetical protein [Rhizobium sp. TRM96650]
MFSYIFGGATGETPESLKRRRELISRMIMGQEQPRNWGQGVGALLTGIASGIERGRLDKAERDGRKSASDQAAALRGRIANSLTGGYTFGAGPGNMPMTGAASEMAATGPAPDVSSNGSTFEPFMSTVQSAGLTNPNGLAAVAATGRAESGWSPANAGRTWSDPSESGQAGTSGGVMSWRAERLAKLQRYAASKGEQGNGSPQTQAEFFMQEDPQLIARLNSARSPEEAQQMMNNAWRFAGFDRPGGEAGRRMGFANAYAPQFQGQGTEVASLDPSAGMPPAAAAIEQQAPGSGYVDTMVSAPNYAPQQAAANLPPLPSREVPPAPQLAPVQPVQQAPQPQQIAQAYPSLDELFAITSNPWSSDEDKAFANMLIERQMQASDPLRQLQLQKAQIELDAARQPKREPLINAGGGSIYDPNKREWLTPPQQGGGTGSFRFSGNSVEAQALNGLMDSGQLTPAQAQQLGAGKTITGPNGEILFLTPQGVFGQSAGGGQPEPVSPDAASVGQPRPSPGNYQITEPKVTLDERKAMGFADRMNSSGSIINDREKAGLGTWDQFVRGNPWIPDVAENWMVSEDFQKFDQARRDFVNAQLRRESGAVISDEEFDNANKQYFPQPGDTPEVLQQKRANRQVVIDSMGRDAGPTYKTGTGEALSEARRAIAAGADRNAVIQRLRDNGIDPEGL